MSSPLMVSTFSTLVEEFTASSKLVHDSPLSPFSPSTFSFSPLPLSISSSTSLTKKQPERGDEPIRLKLSLEAKSCFSSTIFSSSSVSSSSSSTTLSLFEFSLSPPEFEA